MLSEASIPFFESLVSLNLGEWTQVSRAIGEHSNHYTNVWYTTEVVLFNLCWDFDKNRNLCEMFKTVLFKWNYQEVLGSIPTTGK